MQFERSIILKSCIESFSVLHMSVYIYKDSCTTIIINYM